MFDTLFLILIKIYQVTFSAFFGGNCRYHPSCSKYAEEAIKRHGALKGLSFSLTRVSRCHPFSRGGYDPVPPAKV